MIPEEIVYSTIEWFDELNDAQRQEAFEEMQEEQPYLVLLLIVSREMRNLSEHESTAIIEMGVMVCHMMRQLLESSEL